MQDITVLGSTGSIGTQALEVIENLGSWNVKVLTAYQNIDLLYEQIEKFNPEIAVLVNEESALQLKKRLKKSKTKLLVGRKGLLAAASEKVDLLLNALVGFAGFLPSIKAAEAGNDIALANKESLVSGGSILMNMIKEKGLKLLPVDSEHNAVFQLLNGHQSELKEIILTASGGPFFSYSAEELDNVGVEDALDHPNWEMGSKITIDSATLMNKGLEVIEAHWLFDQPYSEIDVIIHPQSIIHSMIRLVDGTILAEMGAADMKIPIQYCLSYPERKAAKSAELELKEIASLEFYEPDTELFPALKYAYQAGEAGGTYPAVLNAANEEAVYSFLRSEIPFTAVSRITSEVLNKHNNTASPELEDIIHADNQARKLAVEVINKCY